MSVIIDHDDMVSLQLARICCRSDDDRILGVLLIYSRPSLFYSTLSVLRYRVSCKSSTCTGFLEYISLSCCCLRSAMDDHRVTKRIASMRCQTPSLHASEMPAAAAKRILVYIYSSNSVSNPSVPEASPPAASEVMAIVFLRRLMPDAGPPPGAFPLASRYSSHPCSTLP